MKGGASVAALVGFQIEAPEPPPLPPALRALQGQVADVERLLRLNDPQGVYALDLVEAR
jgi:hypothetical protein